MLRLRQPKIQPLALAGGLTDNAMQRSCHPPGWRLLLDSWRKNAVKRAALAGSSAGALGARRSERNPLQKSHQKTGTGGTTTPPCVFRVPRMLFQENRPQKPLRRNGFSKSVSWNRILKNLTLFQEKEGVCSKKNEHEKATQSEWSEWLFHPSLTERNVIAIMVTGKRCYQHRLQHMRGNSHTTRNIVTLENRSVKMAMW